jgi:hypothetical protein
MLMWGALSDRKTSISFTIYSGPLQRRNSRVRFIAVFYRLRFETHKPGGSGPYIYIPMLQDCSVIAPGIGFSSHRLPRLEGGIQNPPPRLNYLASSNIQSYVSTDDHSVCPGVKLHLGRTGFGYNGSRRKRNFQNGCSLVAMKNVFAEPLLSNGCCIVAVSLSSPIKGSTYRSIIAHSIVK